MWMNNLISTLDLVYFQYNFYLYKTQYYYQYNERFNLKNINYYFHKRQYSHSLCLEIYLSSHQLKFYPIFNICSPNNFSFSHKYI